MTLEQFWLVVRFSLALPFSLGFWLMYLPAILFLRISKAIAGHTVGIHFGGVYLTDLEERGK